MKIQFLKSKLVNLREPILVVPIYQKEKFSGQMTEVDKKLGGFISEIIKEGYFDPELGQVHVLYSQDKLKCKKIVLVGLGEKKEINIEKLYNAISGAVAYVGRTKVKECAVYVGKQKLQDLQNLAETSILSLYKTHLHKTKRKETNLARINFIIEDNHPVKELAEIAKLVEINAEAIYYARDLVNHPSNIITPKKLAQEAKNLSKGYIETTIFGELEMKKMKMDLFLSVAKGSDEEAQLIVLDYKPVKYKKTIALVGKGLTFDTGGSSLKPSDAMEGMQMDMSGAAAVLGTFLAISKLQPVNIRIIGVIPATENMISAKSQKPGDIWRAYNGKTVEVLNTDAEGRLVLADALSYVQEKYNPDYTIDVATLTGACVVALGLEYIAIFGNDQEFVDKIKNISNNSYEKLWQLPLNDGFREQLKGEVADLKNIGDGREGGASTGAAFLENFVDPKKPWAHLDLAPAIRKKPTSYLNKGGTGSGTKTLLELVRKLAD